MSSKLNYRLVAIDFDLSVLDKSFLIQIGNNCLISFTKLLHTQLGS